MNVYDDVYDQFKIITVTNRKSVIYFIIITMFRRDVCYDILFAKFA
jgi:hypothetical protein